MMQFVKLLRKIAVLVIGIPIVALGIILIPLPGPGLLVCFLGLFILSFEFETARKYRRRITGDLRKIWQNAKARSERIALPDEKYKD